MASQTLFATLYLQDTSQDFVLVILQWYKLHYKANAHSAMCVSFTIEQLEILKNKMLESKYN